MRNDSTIDMITALQSCGLAALTFARVPGSDSLELNAPAAEFLGCPARLKPTGLAGLGPEIDAAGGSSKLGDWLAERLSGTKKPPVIEAVACKGGQFLLSIETGDSLGLFEVVGTMAPHARRELRHRFRNHLNAVVMNIELIAMLADQTSQADIARAAARIEQECRECIKSLDLL